MSTNPTEVIAPIVTIYSWKDSGDGTNDHYSGISGGDPVEAFVDAMKRHGHAITGTSDEPTAHRVSGSGVAHVDSRFAEAGVSMAAYYENDRQWGSWVDGDPQAFRGMFGRDFETANR